MRSGPHAWWSWDRYRVSLCFARWRFGKGGCGGLGERRKHRGIRRERRYQSRMELTFDGAASEQTTARWQFGATGNAGLQPGEVPEESRLHLQSSLGGIVAAYRVHAPKRHAGAWRSQ
jgi:hypothetical protein